MYVHVKPSRSLVSSGYEAIQYNVDGFKMNVATVTCKTTLSCVSSFVIYLTEDRKMAAFGNVTELWHKHFEFLHNPELCILHLSESYCILWQCKETYDYEIEYECDFQISFYM